MVRAWIFRRVHGKRNDNLISKKTMARVCISEVCKIQCKNAYPLKLVKAHYNWQNSEQEKEKPDNESPEDIAINRGTTYHLKNGRNWVRTKIFQVLYDHLLTRKICYRHTETMWIDCILPSAFIDKHISFKSSRINS